MAVLPFFLFITLNLIDQLRTCSVISGVMATIATTPKASFTTSPPTAVQAPCASGSRKVAVIGPDATPPESNAIAVKIFGTNNVRNSAMA